MDHDGRILCAGGAMAAPRLERINAAAEAGFTEIVLFPLSPDSAHETGLSDAGFRAHLGHRGLRVAYLDGLTGWLPGGTGLFPGLMGAVDEKTFFEMARRMGTTAINTIDLCAGDPPPLDVAAEAFAGLCDRASEFGLRIHLEFVPWTRIPTLRAAWDVVRTADRPNGGICLDALHWFRGGGTVADLDEVPAERVFAVQLCDAPAKAPDDLIGEAMNGRYLPGRGDIPLVDLVRALDERGCHASAGLEFLSDDLDSLPTDEVIALIGGALEEVLTAARR